ncbi:MAG: precorrin-2 C(20)-methyltransferase [Oscillospiraceae bacterium]|jgi:precorrin-2/cobalt-factor-2 C20-methyltransferase|nr:precorrin-2 C(20)-methyltransferase [Oscillospiraceae bacterium]
MKGILYGIGVGPGDPELLTLKAVNILWSADIIAASERGSGHAALGIAERYIRGKALLLCPAQTAADAIAKQLGAGKSVAFITPGDPSVYSAFTQIRRRVAELGYETATVPGITHFCAEAANAGEALCDKNEPLLVLPSALPAELKGRRNFTVVREPYAN